MLGDLRIASKAYRVLHITDTLFEEEIENNSDHTIKIHPVGG